MPVTPSTGTGAAAREDARRAAPSPRSGQARRRRLVAAAFLLPALVLLGALVVHPIGYSVYRSLFDRSGDRFVGGANYAEILRDDAIRTAVENTAVWVVVAPAAATALGLVFAVLTERVRWGTAFKLLVFMPMAISMLAAGIIFRLVYDHDPNRGVANAVLVAVHDTFAPSSAFPGARPGRDSPLVPGRGADAGGYLTREPVRAGTPALLPLVGVAPAALPEGTRTARPAAAEPGRVTGTAWQDFTRGGGGRTNAVDPAESAFAGMRIEAVKEGRVVESATTGADGTFSMSGKADGALLRLPASNFREAYAGVDWLGPALVTPAIIGAYVWMWAGFAMVLIAAGLASVPRELLEAARVDGANEWQVFRRITVPLLAPVLAVVLVTLVINVMKIFDLVFVIAPGSVQDDANVLALQLYRTSFGTDADAGLGSAIAVLLLVLVVPVMLYNIRRMRREARR
ncbi:carbohydrate ABC transporter permease [Streptomyces sp. NPDC004244]